MAASGPGTFFDGATSARRGVSVELEPDVLRIRAADGAILAEWPYDRLETVLAPAGVLRLGQAGSPVLARLEVRDPRLAAAMIPGPPPVITVKPALASSAPVWRASR